MQSIGGVPVEHGSAAIAAGLFAVLHTEHVAVLSGQLSRAFGVWECRKLLVMVEPSFKLTAKVVAATYRVERSRAVGPDTTCERGDDRGLVWIEEERT